MESFPEIPKGFWIQRAKLRFLILEEGPGAWFTAEVSELGLADNGSSRLTCQIESLAQGFEPTKLGVHIIHLYVKRLRFQGRTAGAPFSKHLRHQPRNSTTVHPQETSIPLAASRRSLEG